MTVAIRDATPADAETIAAGEHETARTPGFLNALPGEIPVPAFRDKIASIRADGHGLYTVAERDGVVIGHLLLDPLPLAQLAHVCTLNVVVYPNATDRGIGRALLEHAIAWSRRNRAVEKIELHVRAGNERAIHLYRSLGFQEEGRIRRRVKLATGAYEDDLVMGLFVDGDQG
ncbi:MAG: GNAT family N-acetyltransferase [Pseudomonadales bacterium]